MSQPASTRLYLSIFLTLVCLTIVTVALSYVNMTHTGNVIAALLVAACKASLVALFFMHLKYEGKLLWLTATFPLLLFLIMNVALFLDIVFFLKP